jgi:hypothetical protein
MGIYVGRSPVEVETGRFALLGVVLGGSREAIIGIFSGGDVKSSVRIEEIG